MIIFEKIRWKNFLSTGNQFTEIELNKNCSTLIQGSNGAGKSTILDAICFGLFNKPFRKINKPQLVNTINERDCVVEIEFTIGTIKWKVVRGIKPAKFEIYRDDNPLDQDAASLDQQKWLEQNILKMNFKSFTQVVILGSSTFIPFMQLTPAYRREVIEDILDIQIFSTMNVLLKDRLRQVQEQQRECGYELKSADGKVKMQEEHIRNSQMSNAGEIELKSKEISSLEEEVFEIKKYINILETENVDIHTEIVDFDDVNRQINKLNGLKFKISHNNSAAYKELHFFEGNDSCPTCTQLIEKTFKDRKISDLSSKTEEYEQAILQLESQHVTLDKKYSAMLRKQDKLKRNHADIMHQNNLIALNEKTLNKINSEIQRLSESPDIAKMKGKLEVYQEEYCQIEQRCSDVSKQKDVYEVVSNLLKDSGIKSQVIKKYVPIFNKLINKYLASMDFYANFTLDEEFNEVIKSRYRDAFSYSSFSEGEKQKIDLSILFCWREIARMKNSVSTNLLILDEVFDSSLDTNGTEDLLKILKNLDNSTNVFVISHKGEILTDRFSNNIRFDKVQDFSKIVEEVSQS